MELLSELPALAPSPTTACPVKASLKQRPTMGPDEALAVEALFSVLANDTRLRILHELARRDEAGPGELAETLELKPQAISNQLQRLSDKGIVAARRRGSFVRYRIVDRCVEVLLERGLCLIEEESRRAERRRDPARRPPEDSE